MNQANKCSLQNSMKHKSPKSVSKLIKYSIYMPYVPQKEVGVAEKTVRTRNWWWRACEKLAPPPHAIMDFGIVWW